MYFLGIDLGTSSVKIILMNEEGAVIESVTKEYPVYYPQNGWAEQNPEEWWQATKEGIRKLLTKVNINTEEIKALGLSGQMHGSVVLDKDNNILMPAILWCDQRTLKECEEITEKLGKEKLSKYTGNKALTGFTAPKILWIKKYKPEVYRSMKHILLPKDYIRFKLTGKYATDVSDASGTLLFDVENRRWSSEMLEELDISEDMMPKCYESYEVTGCISEVVAEELGLKGEVKVVGGGGDQAAGAVGTGTVKSGIVSVALGTSGVVFACQDQYSVDEDNRLHSFCHSNGKWHVMGVMLSAASCLKWWVENVNKEIKEDTYDKLLKEIEDTPPGSNQLFFLPYLLGERTPYSDPDAKGGFIGLTITHERKDMTRAVIEGVSFGLNDSLQIIRELNIPVKEVRVSGGGARSKIWRQILADIFNSKVSIINATEGAAYGAAILAAVGYGLFSTVDEACEKLVKATETIEPIEKNVHLYRKLYGIYNSLYPVLADSFKKISEVDLKS